MKSSILCLVVPSCSAFAVGTVKNHPARSQGLQLHANTFPSVLDWFKPFSKESSNLNKTVSTSKDVIQSLIRDINDRVDPAIIASRYFEEDARVVDTAFYNPIQGRENLIRHFYLNQDSSPLSTFSKKSNQMIVIDNTVEEEGRVAALYHLEDENAQKIPDSESISFYTLKNGFITTLYDYMEPESPKPGDMGLKLLKSVSNLIGSSAKIPMMEEDTSTIGSNSQVSVERYFESWNKRNMKKAISCFSDDIRLRDTQYPDAFDGKEALEKHLLNVASCLPGSFQFVVDDISNDGRNVAVRWHVESNGKELAFTRGCSFYTLDQKTGLIKTGIEIPERAPPKPKPGHVNTIMSKFKSEPIRIIPAAAWIMYMWIVFFSEGILPGANALSLEVRTWEEVRDLSINFFLVSPLLGLPFSPVVHPMLEGVFNLLLAWAAMFAGFLSDERKNKPNLFEFGPAVVGMQFLTSAFLLPYLVLRTPEKGEEDIGIVFKEDISGSIQSIISEWRPLGPFLSAVGTSSILWGFFGRPEFGSLSERFSSFTDLLSVDRVGSSFLVDLVIFALFQGWFVDDDLLRRGVKKGEMAIIRNFAKFVPFFGLAAYLTIRPELPSMKKD